MEGLSLTIKVKRNVIFFFCGQMDKHTGQKLHVSELSTRGHEKSGALQAGANTGLLSLDIHIKISTFKKGHNSVQNTSMIICPFSYMFHFDSKPFTAQCQFLILLGKSFENIVGKGENAGNKHILLFPQCFLAYQRKLAPFELH